MARPSIGRRPGPTTLLVGAASRDIDDHDPRGWRLGGGVVHGALAVARLGLPVRALVGVDRAAATASELDTLRASGVEVRLCALDRGPVFDNQRLSADGARHQVAHSPSDRIGPDALPAAWWLCEAVVLAPVAGELPDEWARAVPAGRLVSLGWQGVARLLVAGHPVAALPLVPSALIERADLGVVSAEDARAGGAVLSALLPRRGQRLVVTHGPRGALLVERRAKGLACRSLPVRPAERVVDATGAGDVLLATWTAASAALRWAGRDDPPAGALRVAIAAAEAKVECPDLAATPDLRGIMPRVLRRHG